MNSNWFSARNSKIERQIVPKLVFHSKVKCLSQCLTASFSILLRWISRLRFVFRPSFSICMPRHATPRHAMQCNVMHACYVCAYSINLLSALLIAVKIFPQLTAHTVYLWHCFYKLPAHFILVLFSHSFLFICFVFFFVFIFATKHICHNVSSVRLLLLE